MLKKHTVYIAYLFQKKCSDEFIKWLCRAPIPTSIRVNSIISSYTAIQNCIQLHLNKNSLTNKIDTIETMSELILIYDHTNPSTPLEIDPKRKEIIVDVHCGSSVLRGAHIYAPGVLAMQTNTKLNEIVNIFVDLNGKCKKGFAAIYKSDYKLFIGIGIARMQRYQLYSNVPCNGTAIEMMQTISNVPSIGDSFLPLGEALLQNLPSVVCVRVLCPHKNDVILDMCAAPGHKTTHIAQLINNEGTIVALDKSENRVNLLQKNLTNFHAKCVAAYAYDATKCYDEKVLSSLEPPFGKDSFDRILLDAPCSGSGNRPLLKFDMSEKMVNSYPKIQRKLLCVALELLKPGGILVYSTCSVFPQENEENIKWFIDRFHDRIDLVVAEPMHGNAGWSNHGLTEQERHLVQRFGPNFDDEDQTNDIFNDNIGFFIAKLKKKMI